MLSMVITKKVVEFSSTKVKMFNICKVQNSLILSDLVP